MQAIYEQIVHNKNKSGVGNDQIYELSLQIKNSIQMLENCESQRQKNAHRRLLMSYINILAQTSQQLQESKKRYESIDKEALIDKRCEELTTSLDFFKKEAFSLNDQIKKMNSQVLNVKKSNDVLKWNIQGLKKQLKIRESSTKQQKLSYMEQTPFISEPRHTQLVFPSNNNYSTCDHLLTERMNEVKTGRLSIRSKNRQLKEAKQYFSEVDYQAVKKST